MAEHRKRLEAQQPAVSVVVERHRDGYVAYAVGLRGVVVGEGNTYEAALADVRSAIRFHRATFRAHCSPRANAQGVDSAQEGDSARSAQSR